MASGKAFILLFCIATATLEPIQAQATFGKCADKSAPNGETWNDFCEKLKFRKCQEFTSSNPTCGGTCLENYVAVSTSPNKCIPKRCSDVDCGNKVCRKEPGHYATCGECKTGFKKDPSDDKKCIEYKCGDKTENGEEWNEFCKKQGNMECKDGTGTGQLCRCVAGTELDLVTGACKKTGICCSDLSDIPNQNKTSGSCKDAIVGDKCTFTCIDGSTQTVTCSVKLQWDSKPVCKELPKSPCDNSRLTKNGDTPYVYCEERGARCVEVGNQFSCRCDPEQVFDVASELCIDPKVSACDYLNPGPNEKCVDGTLVCKDGFKREDNDKPCLAQSYCKDYCGEANCTENAQDPQKPFCFCTSGFYYSNKKCLSYACSFRSLNNCPQECEATTYKHGQPAFTCKCKTGYQLKENACVPVQDGCTKACGRGACVKVKNEDKCDCHTHFELDDKGICTKPARLCAADSVGNKYCGKYEWTGNQFVCVCAGKYEADGDGACKVREKCTVEEENACKTRNAECDPSRNFACKCRDGFEMEDSGHCVEGCTSKKQFECSSLGATCSREQCQCNSPYMGWDYSNGCQFVSGKFPYHLALNGIRRRSDDKSDIPSLPADVNKAAPNIFGSSFHKINEINCRFQTSDKKYIDCDTVMFLSLPNDAASLNAALHGTGCVPSPLSEDCVIGGRLLVKKGAKDISQVQNARGACDSTFNRCQTDKSNTECVTDPKDQSKAFCQCKDGYQSDLKKPANTFYDVFRPNYCYAKSPNKDAAIVGAILGVLLFLVLIVAGVAIFKLRRK